jgi:hypothetical protein
MTEVEWNNKKEKNSLDTLPESWDGVTRAEKVEQCLGVVQDQLSRVRRGEFNVTHGPLVAALALESQLELADFYADAEAAAKNAKNIIEYMESESACKFVEEANNKKIKSTEAAVKRYTSLDQAVKDSKKEYIDLEREHKKWKCVFEILKDAHVFFRNIDKV